MSPLNRERVSQEEVSRGYHRLYQGALAFYSDNETGELGQLQHRKITEAMTLDALRLAVSLAQERGIFDNCKNILFTSPLRGGAGPVNLESLALLGDLYPEKNVVPAAIGVKRHVDTMSTKIYHETTPEDIDYATTGIIIIDWGTATGMTGAATASVFRDRGVLYENMMTVSMTLPKEGEDYISTHCPGIFQFAATRSRMNEMRYIAEIAPVNSDGSIGHFVNIQPKDWGDWMFGMWANDNQENILSDIRYFIDRFLQVYSPYYSEEVMQKSVQSLLSYYSLKHLGQDLGYLAEAM